MKKVLLFAQGFFGEKVYEALKANNIYAELYTYAAASTRRKSDKEHLRDGFPYRYIHERSFDASLIQVGEESLILCADWTKDFFHKNPPPCLVYHIHPSLLPMYRGYGAVSEQFLKGVTLSGVTLYRDDGGIDTGPILFQEKLRIAFDDIPADFLTKAAACAGSWAARLVRGDIPSEKTQEGFSFYSQRRRKPQTTLDLNVTALYAYNTIRAYSAPFSGALLMIGNKQYIIRRANCEKWTGVHGTPGEVISLSAYGAELACGEGSIIIRELEFEGKHYQNAEVSELFTI